MLIVKLLIVGMKVVIFKKLDLKREPYYSPDSFNMATTTLVNDRYQKILVITNNDCTYTFVYIGKSMRS